VIRRYTLPEMGAIWTDRARFEAMLRVELAVSRAQAARGAVPADALAAIEARAAVDPDRIAEIEKTTDHDVIAFVSQVAESIGPEGRYLHLGLTSSDVIDTAFAVQMVQSADILIADVEQLRGVIAKKARDHMRTPMIGRSHGIHAEPTTFGLKMALMHDEFGRALERLRRARETVAVGKLSGAVGTSAHLSPKVEEYVCRNLGLRPAPIATQVIQRDIHAEFIGESVTRALMEIQLENHIPVIHEVLLLENQEQARERCLTTKHNRGTEAAQTALKMAAVMNNLA